MENEANNFLQAEETAEKLVHTLQALQSEATSYRTATKELDTVREQLLSLIEATKQVAANSLESIQILKSIGGPQIFNKLEEIEINTLQQLESITKHLKKLNIVVLLTFAFSIGIGILTFLK